MENIVRHWLPCIKQQKNNINVYRSFSCPFSNYTSKSNRIFRYNSKIKVGKCYHCGKSFKNIDWFIKQIKETSIENYDLVRCEYPKEDYFLPF